MALRYFRFLRALHSGEQVTCFLFLSTNFRPQISQSLISLLLKTAAPSPGAAARLKRPGRPQTYSNPMMVSPWAKGLTSRDN
jgi:hypothetical protein